MNVPLRFTKGSWQNWAGRLVLFGGVGLFMYRAVNEWSRSGLGLLVDAMIIAIAVTGLNLITGYTGQLSLGHAAFFAIGAFTSATLVTGKIWTPFLDDNIWTPGWTLLASAVVCFLVGMVVGIPALRLKGIYLALVTLVFTEAVRAIFKYDEFSGVTGGATGIKGFNYLPPSWTGLDGRADLVTWFFYLTLAILVVVSILSAGLIRSRIGRAMVAVRDNETAAAVMGVNLFTTKTLVFGLSGAIAGVAGSLYALKLTLVEADVPLFGLFGSVTLLVALVVGGAAQNWGPFVGAMFYVFVNDYARSVGEDPSSSLLLGWFVDSGTTINGLGGVTFGVMLILFARFVPFGAVGTMRMWRSKVVQVVPRPPIPAAAAPEAGAAAPTLEQGHNDPDATTQPAASFGNADSSSLGDDEDAS
ncbi:MAG TPA: branched-chain amino acid ABC transporter permease [Ilumatobacteraceae bacterium]|nr:branched-chain amino acid ABC transporter permease [Ilumatobacteraceae bacterium]